jgi:hypothetical protein
MKDRDVAFWPMLSKKASILSSCRSMRRLMVAATGVRRR